ncbi:DNA repair exonuclease [Weissella diestrammenae]|uniref:DNA repair exonuclease n=1 Tax=Weissella diestrammenae TaxID=1162633 RepID=A0A7G9T4E5_9LACO|nr:DNA repair exonuclease [Weissella diestrammenae]MCM0583506.1 DNA repair exonuclease [Weissella diestrammenae]QNN74970.1 DNA repair exonuclease [Weissella diestrammenae]
MKFIHAGDLHLGNAFVGLSDVPDWVLSQLQVATLTAFQNLINCAIQKRVDFVLLPGDIYNTHQVNPQIQLFFIEQMNRLNDVGIQVVLSYGNHDYITDFATQMSLPENVTVLSHEVQTLHMVTQQGETVAISGFSYAKQHIHSAMVTNFPSEGQDKYHIGMYHGELGQDGQGDYAPFSISEMNEKHYDYWALGHIHIRKTLQSHPFIGYSGSLQGLNRKENGEKGFYLVSENSQGWLVPEFIAAAPIVWGEQTVTMNEDLTLTDFVMQIREQMTKVVNTDLTLINLTIKTENWQLIQLLSSPQFQHQMNVASRREDQYFVYQIHVEMARAQNEMPVIADEYWENTFNQLISLDSLQKNGLNIVQNLAVFDYFSRPQTMDDMGEQVQEIIRQIQGGLYRVD